MMPMTPKIKMLLIILFAMVSVCLATAPSTCSQCQQSQACAPPNCFCCRDELSMSQTEIPQMVFFTFDDAVTPQVASFYRQLFDGNRKNPNDCPIKMTLFISHANTVYSLVREFFQKGMEIAAHSVTHNHMKLENFVQEAKKQKENLARLAKVPEGDIKGWRSPFLEPLGDDQPNILKQLGYKYDATLTISKHNLDDKAPFPFTLDFGWPYDCKIRPCPTRRHSGFWEVPVISLLDYLKKYDCVYVDGCNNPPPNEESAYKFLMDNFQNYYSTNRAPFGINMHASWFFYPDRLKAMDRFIKTLSKMNDVYVVSVSQVIAWLANPTPISRLHSFEPWQCGGNRSMSSSSRASEARSAFQIRQRQIQERIRKMEQLQLQQQQERLRQQHMQWEEQQRNKRVQQQSGTHQSVTPVPASVNTKSTQSLMTWQDALRRHKTLEQQHRNTPTNMKAKPTVQSEQEHLMNQQRQLELTRQQALLEKQMREKELEEQRRQQEIYRQSELEKQKRQESARQKEMEAERNRQMVLQRDRAKQEDLERRRLAQQRLVEQQRLEQEADMLLNKQRQRQKQAIQQQQKQMELLKQKKLEEEKVRQEKEKERQKELALITQNQSQQSDSTIANTNSRSNVISATVTKHGDIRGSSLMTRNTAERPWSLWIDNKRKQDRTFQDHVTVKVQNSDMQQNIVSISPVPTTPQTFPFSTVTRHKPNVVWTMADSLFIPLAHSGGTSFLHDNRQAFTKADLREHAPASIPTLADQTINSALITAQHHVSTFEKLTTPGFTIPISCVQNVNCRQPLCFCKTETVPGGVQPENIPQIVYITIDGDINFHSYSKVSSLFAASRLNPNGCRISGTFFASDTGTSYRLAQLLYWNGIEIALNGIKTTSYNNARELENDIVEQIKRLTSKTAIESENLKGWKSPRSIFGDEQFEILRNRTMYDSSLVLSDRSQLSAKKIWPFTLDFGWNEPCETPQCPTVSHPGVWEVPIIPLIDVNNSTSCKYIDGCTTQPYSKMDTFQYLWNNFESYYKTNRAPFGIRLQQTWFHWYYADNFAGLETFIDKILSLNNVYIVSVSKMIDWIKHPTTLSAINQFQPWQC